LLPRKRRIFHRHPFSINKKLRKLTFKLDQLMQAGQWANTDVLMNVRTGLKPAERGLQPNNLEKIWGFPADYPQRVS
jgi:hypothetical protein